MTTAHRPTWKPAVGRGDGGGWTAGGTASGRTATLDLASHTKLKFRKGEQVVDKRAALRDSLLKLEEAEKKAPLLKRPYLDLVAEEEGRKKLLKQTAEVDEERIRSKYNDGDEKGNSEEDDGWSDLDDDDSDLDESETDSDDDDDDEAALQAELAKIRAEREAAKLKEQKEDAAKDEAKMEEAALIGNPLLQSAGEATGKMKRKWNDDVVFRNQAKGEPEIKKRFINDTIRNDFHKRFLDKFIK
eukprot:CAMPEP_0194242526 /NCGR_PEP_ID=MMETSP0158-20130606/8031_1 /TAXON_ID=33649 /ORGANISM="Thalassionema nitzschioides, Strain L26-B" /LENGTH=243 /DNA_ID=CAMNT_0038977633 /DNA_START=13 /DNA_END=744 /DNA_ORIENTATION=-